MEDSYSSTIGKAVTLDVQAGDKTSTDDDIATVVLKLI